jgi:hypothetical protein
LGLVVEFNPFDARLSPGSARTGIDTDTLHGREIDNDASVANAVAWKAVPTSAHRYLQPIIPSKVHGPYDVRGASTASNQGWATVKHAVPQLPTLIIGIAARK